MFICSYLAGHWDLTLGWIGGGFAALSNLDFLFPLHNTDLGVVATPQVVQRDGSFGQPGWLSARAPARWQPLATDDTNSNHVLAFILIQISDFDNGWVVVDNR